MAILSLFFFGTFSLFIFREKGGEREREGEKHQCVREISSGCLSHTTNRGPGLQHRYVPWLGFEQVTFWYVRWYPILWATQSGLCQSFLAWNVSVKKLADSLMGALLKVNNCLSVATFKILSLSLTFAILIMRCLGVGLFGFIMFRSLWASWPCVSFSFTRLGNFLVIISSDRFLIPFSLSLLLLVSLWYGYYHTSCYSKGSWN